MGVRVAAPPAGGRRRRVRGWWSGAVSSVYTPWPAPPLPACTTQHPRPPANPAQPVCLTAARYDMLAYPRGGGVKDEPQDGGEEVLMSDEDMMPPPQPPTPPVAGKTS